MTPNAVPMNRDAALRKQRPGFNALMGMDTKAVVDVMEVVLGRRLYDFEAVQAMRDAKHDMSGQVEQAVTDFKKSQFDVRGTCLLHRVMTGKRV